MTFAMWYDSLVLSNRTCNRESIRNFKKNPFKVFSVKCQYYEVKKYKDMKIKCMILSLLLACMCSGCSDDNDVRGDGSDTPVVKDVIIDTDLGNCTDDVLALQILFKYQAENRCRILGVMQDWKVEKAKVLADCFLRYYKADDLPLGLVEGEEPVSELIPYFQMVDSTYADGSPWLARTGTPLNERPVAWKLYRKLLSLAEDHSVYIICVGAFTNLGLLLQSQPDEYSPLAGKDLVAQKVKQLDVTGGCFSKVKLSGEDDYVEAEYNIAIDVPLAKTVLEQWPVPLHMLPMEEGLKFPSEHEEVLADYEWNPNSLMYRIYANYDERDTNQCWWDALTVMHTIEPENFFSCTKQGKLKISDKGVTTFEQDDKGNAHIISVDLLHNLPVYNFLRSAAKWKP